MTLADQPVRPMARRNGFEQAVGHVRRRDRDGTGPSGQTSLVRPRRVLREISEKLWRGWRLYRERGIDGDLPRAVRRHRRLHDRGHVDRRARGIDVDVTRPVVEMERPPLRVVVHGAPLGPAAGDRCPSKDRDVVIEAGEATQRAGQRVAAGDAAAQAHRTGGHVHDRSRGSVRGPPALAVPPQGQPEENGGHRETAGGQHEEDPEDDETLRHGELAIGVGRLDRILLQGGRFAPGRHYARRLTPGCETGSRWRDAARASRAS